MKQHRRLKTTFWLDIALLVSVCVLQTVRFTGLVIHEWLGLALIVMVLAHLLFSWNWIATQSRRLFGRQTVRERINYLLNLLLFACLTAALFSGILISQKAVPVLDSAETVPVVDMQWAMIHEISAVLVLFLSGFHLAINWDWLLAAAGNVFRRFRESTL